MAVIVELDVMLARRKMSVGDFADAVGITRRTSPFERTGAPEPSGSPPWTRSAGCSIASPVTSSGGPPTRPPSGPPEGAPPCIVLVAFSPGTQSLGHIHR